MPSELRPLVGPLALTRGHRPPSPFSWGAAGGIEVVAGLTGVGMAAGARSAARMLDETSPEHLIVVGIAGGIGGRIAIGDVVVPESVVNLETGEKLYPAPLGSAPQGGILASSDVLLESPGRARELGADGVVAVDMESAAIASVCARRRCPFSVFRGISDRADDGTTDAAVLSLIDAGGNPKPAAVVRFVLRRPERILQLLRLALGTRAATRAAAAAVLAALYEA